VFARRLCEEWLRLGMPVAGERIVAALLGRGIRSAHIIDGSQRNALLSEVFTDEGTGTMIVA